MSKLQILLVVVAIGSVFLIYQLPKGIIKKESKIEVAEKPITQEASIPSKVHASKVTEKDKVNLTLLTKEYQAFLNTEKKIIFADSLANSYRRLHQYDSAAKYAGEIVRFDSSLKKLERAGDAYSEAYTMASDDQKPYFNEQSQAFYKRIIEKAPGNLEVKSKLALTYIGSETPMQGVLMLREVIKADPKNETALYNLGILSLQSGQYGKAIGRFKELIDINPSNANAHFYLGVSFMNAGDKKKARIAFEAARALENDPAFQATVTTYLKELEH